jgi:chromosome segregation ATPase
MLAGWKLVEPAEKSVETTATAYRVAVDLKPGEAKTVTFVFEAPRIESTRIADFDDRSLAQVTATREIEPAVRNALVELARLRRVVAEKKQAEAQIKAEIAEITEDQTRIRANLESVDKESALHKRYIEKLAQEETRLEALQADRAKAADATRAAQASVDAYIAKLSI